MTLYLCLCQYGHSRSVALCRVLHAKGQQAIAAGVGTADKWVPLLSVLADKILVLEPHYAKLVPEDCRDKIIDFNVGRDRWSNPYSPELQAILEKMVQEKLRL